MPNELLLADTVRVWAGKMLPNDPRGVEYAARVAQLAYQSGASVSEACRVAQTFVGCRTRHPSQGKAGDDVVVGLAPAS